MLREVRAQVGTPGFRTRQRTLVTTRLDAELSRVADLAERYRLCWQVETALAQLKTPRQMDVLHGKTGPGVLKAVAVVALVDNLVRMVMRPSATRQRPAVERISVLDALRWRRAPRTGMPLVALMGHPARPHRVEPRLKKRRPTSFPLMITCRQELRQPLVQHERSGSLHAIRPRALNRSNPWRRIADTPGTLAPPHPNRPSADEPTRAALAGRDAPGRHRVRGTRFERHHLIFEDLRAGIVQP
jgi:hypothetical protein